MASKEGFFFFNVRELTAYMLIGIIPSSRKMMLWEREDNCRKDFLE